MSKGVVALSVSGGNERRLRSRQVEHPYWSAYFTTTAALLLGLWWYLNSGGTLVVPTLVVRLPTLVALSAMSALRAPVRCGVAQQSDMRWGVACSRHYKRGTMYSCFNHSLHANEIPVRYTLPYVLCVSLTFMFCCMLRPYVHSTCTPDRCFK